MKVYEGLARAFVGEGVSAVFGIMGDANMYWMNAMHKLGVKLYDVRHEGAGLAMADGYGRMSRTPGVCTTTGGPGFTQLATTMVVASRARTPLVAFVGEWPMEADETSQHFDHERFANGIECGFVRVLSPDGVDDAVRKAFYQARLESRPVVLSAPMDVQQKAYDDSDPYVPSAAVYEPDPVAPNPERLREAADILASAQRPVIVVGRGAMRPGVGDLAMRLADRTGALLATTLMAKTWLNEYPYHVGISGNYSTRTAIQLFQDADCVVAVGASLNRYTLQEGYLYPNARYVHFDARPHVLMGGGRSADCFVHSDARLGLEALEQALVERGVQSTGYHTPDVTEKLKHNFDDPAEYEIEPGAVDPRDVCLALDQAIPSEVALVLGGGQQICFTTMLFNRPRSWLLANQHFGCIGQGLTTAMGALIATGNTPTFMVEGDVGLMMHLAEIETAVRYNLPLLVVVMNDQALGAEYHKSRAHHMDESLATVTTPDLGAVARSFGGRGALARTVDEVVDAAKQFVADPGPMVLDVRISRNVLSIPYRRLHFGEDA